MDIFSDFLGWYLSPLLRIQRHVFNWIFLLIVVPGLFIGSSSLGAMKGSFDQISGQLSGVAAVGANPGDAQGVPDVSGLMQQMMGSPATPAKGASFNWGDLFNVVLVLVLAPLVAGRARDMGMRHPWWLTAVVFLAPVNDLLALLGLDTGLGLAFDGINFIMLSWMCMRPSKVRVKPVIPGMTAESDTAKVRDDDIRPY